MSIPHLWHHAAALSARAHRHQLRKDEVTPYAAHPFRVALTVALVFGVTDETLVAAALLHDVIEDTDVDYDDIHETFGAEVADLVAVLTKDRRLVEPVREEAYHRGLAEGPWQGRLIKLADVYDNLADAHGASAQRSAIGKARAAIAAVGDDDRLRGPCDQLRELIKGVERSIAETR